MKSHYAPKYTKRELQAMQEVCDRQIQEGIKRAQWLMLIAFNDTLGIGAERFKRVMTRYAQLVDDYGLAQKDGVEDEMLNRRVGQILGG